MTTVIIDSEKVSIERFYGGNNKGVCFNIDVREALTQKEVAEMIGKLMEGLIVSGEGKVGQ